MCHWITSASMLTIGLLISILSGIVAAPSDTAGEDVIKALQNEVLLLRNEVAQLNKTVGDMEEKMITNIVDQYADKTIQNVILNDQREAAKFWMELLNHAKQQADIGVANRLNELLSKVIMKSYSGNRSNFYPLMEFILRNNITTAYPLLHKELVSHGHVFGGQELFVLAYYLKQNCGSSTQLYKSLPSVVRNIVSGPVIFRNIDNNGYIIATQHQPCTSRDECYGNPKNEAFIHKISSSLSESQVVNNPRAHWQFYPPITMDMRNGFNGTRMSWGFHIRSVSEDKFLIVKLRLTSYFLRDNTTFDSYYAGELQCQFMPTLTKTKDNNSNVMMVGLRDKYIHKTEYIHGAKFGKKGDKQPIGRRNHNDPEGKLWEVTPVTMANKEMESSSSSSVENGLDNSTEDNTVMSDSKCQF